VPIPVADFLIYKGCANHPSVAKAAIAMRTVPVDNRSISIPALVPSISSFETQLPPFSALQLQHSLREPVSLVSAYDLRQDEGNVFADLCREFKKTSVLFLDSGGYEHSHAKRYSPNGAPTWTFDDFKTICGLALHDFVFSFDYFWRENGENETPAEFTARLQGEIFDRHDFIAANRLIPVLHLHANKDEKHRLSENEILDLVNTIAGQCHSPFIAIPERELGDGLLDKYRLVKKICDELARQSHDVGLHILGCGNLLSFAYFTVAGARLVDGLEWYRTFVADNFHLHHFQQEPIFISAREGSYNPTADLILAQDLPYRLKVATMNLVSLQTFSSQLLQYLQEGKVHELIAERFGEKAGAKLRELEQ
jgi:hypothetical protein